MSTQYSVTSKLFRITVNNPPVATLGYNNNIELNTTEQANSPGKVTKSFLANIPAESLIAMSQLADSALAVGGQTTIQYQFVTSSTGQQVAEIVSFAYNGKVVANNS